MIIIEGPDKVGKSTLVKALKRELPDWETRHHGVPPVKPFQYFGWFVAGARPRVIVDRMHWSEVAYGTTYRAGSELTLHEWRLLELMLLANHAHVVLLDDATESIVSRWGKGADDPFAVDRVGMLQDAFSDLQTGSRDDFRSHLPSRVHWLPELVNPDTGDWTEALEELVRYERKMTDTVGGYLAPSLAMGSGTDFLLLGEASSDRDQRYTLDPPCPFRDGPASEYLWRALDEIGLRWWRGTYTNERNFRGESDFNGWLQSRGKFQTTVCLGRVADRLAFESKRLGSTHLGEIVSVPHPMFVRRFFYERGYEPWCESLRGALQHVCDAREEDESGDQPMLPGEIGPMYDDCGNLKEVTN